MYSFKPQTQVEYFRLCRSIRHIVQTVTFGLFVIAVVSVGCQPKISPMRPFISSFEPGLILSASTTVSFLDWLEPCVRASFRAIHAFQAIHGAHGRGP